MERKRECKMCGKIKPIHGRGMCDTCYHRVLAQEKITNGICSSCRTRPIDFSRSSMYCSKCLDKQKEDQINLHNKRKNDGRCVQCGKPTDGYHTLCDRCRYMKNDRERIKSYDNELVKVNEYLEGVCDE
jgi:NMD protein affecting ribosome stability and mRNA decay